MGEFEGTPSLWKLLERLPVLRWVAIQMALAAVFASLARAPRLGRPGPDPVSGADRPAAHAEALGALLEAGQALRESHELLDRYRNWRSPHAPREPGRAFSRSHLAASAPASGPDEPAPRSPSQTDPDSP